MAELSSTSARAESLFTQSEVSHRKLRFGCVFNFRNQRSDSKPTGKIAWVSGSRKDAGVEFIDLPEGARIEIKEWLSAESAPEPIRAEEEIVVQEDAPHPQRANRSEKWTSLLAELTSQPTAARTDAPELHVPVHNVAIPLLAETQLEESASPSVPTSLFESDGFAHKKKDGEFKATPSATNELVEQPRDIFPNPETESNDHRKPFEPGDIGSTFTRRPSSELSLPSDTLLNTPSQTFTVVSGGGERFENGEPHSISSWCDAGLSGLRRLPDEGTSPF